MKLTLTASQVADLLLKDELAGWSHEAARALAKYYDDLEADTGSEMELDVVAIRCDWDEYPTAQDLAEAYDIPCEDPEDLDEVVWDYVTGRSDIIALPNGKGYLVRAF